MKQKAIFALSLLAASQGYATEFALKLDTKNPLILTESPVVFAVNEELKALERIDLSQNKSQLLHITPESKGFHYGTTANSKEVQAFILDSKGVYVTTQTKTKRLVSSNSLLTRLETDDFEKIEFVLDVNKDGLSDIYLPGFTRSELYIQQENGQFKQHFFDYNLPLRSHTYSESEELEISTNFTSLPIVHDFNADGINDLVFRTRKQVAVLYGAKNGFANAVDLVHLPTDFGKLKGKKVRTTQELVDINQDGHLDLITRTRPITEGISALEAKVEYDLYLGQPKGFNSGAIKLPHTLGVGGMRVEYDFDGDGLLDLQTMDVDIGLTTIAAIALGGGKADVDVEMRFFRQKPHTLFDKSPSTEKEVELEIDMTRSMRGLPFYTGDLNGDNKHDIVFKSSNKSLYIYYGSTGKLLRNEYKKISRTLPDNPHDIALIDVDRNGRKDFVFKYENKQGPARIEMILN
ncbi:MULTISPECIES: FG-GAP repeat domain-containing protein [Pseudoalteromonas]|uniref:FG-GAP repeat protein n=1 Tax=Pseudoalteromonas luteoviolacea (strain 2ta16) TaxID=1353533 RepID=V4H9J6_PSEL2|nr:MULTISPECIES: VCBS repeat-containing protein [Pseudoalteromonas]ESP94156.1 hypothetical protein PL2TA16_02406 [Pseudoalteromonas luteoviolacea 2ta16]KZN38801.1 hypothetical protein N483_00090 [Pseudoalteromonas luteoviolacea NCIMB 1944]MCG7549612.1 VCBS repeat-containing protein [Pseudoalteromonas sp. Of7M-16]